MGETDIRQKYKELFNHEGKNPMWFPNKKTLSDIGKKRKITKKRKETGLDATVETVNLKKRKKY